MIYAALGPAGSNHALVLGRYIATRTANQSASIVLFSDFHAAFEALLAGRVDRVLQCSAHPSHGECVGRYMHRAFPVDTFIAGSRPLALLARRAAAHPASVGLQPATRHYTDLSAFSEQIEMPTIVDVAEGLVSGRFDAGICALETLERHPGQLRLIEDLGPALDAWVLFGTRPLSDDDPRIV
ncbi:MAG TPA: hypothetical protein VK991_00375 [Halomonas sp.]|nr:hypothetical protein [Halomonas sp.]